MLQVMCQYAKENIMKINYYIMIVKIYKVYFYYEFIPNLL